MAIQQSTGGGARDFFVSFNQRDRPWATWIAWVLEQNDWSTWFQDWDFRHNFLEHMNEAHRKSNWTIAVLSGNYVSSEFATLEWTARIAKDTKRVIPVRVGRLSEQHILDAMLYADLLDCDEKEAERRLVAHVRNWLDHNHRAKPEDRPRFPGVAPRTVPDRPRFPLAEHNLPLANQAFVGRTGELDQLARGLASSGRSAITQRPQAITGLGGIGKTQALPHFPCNSPSVGEGKTLRSLAVLDFAPDPGRGSTTIEEPGRNSLLSQGDHSSPAALPARKVRESHSQG